MRVVVIGNGMVGQRVVESLAGAQDPANAGTVPLEITVLCEEPRVAYDRVQLSSMFSGKAAEDLSLVPAGFFDRPGLRLMLAQRAAGIDRERRCVRTSGGEELAYDVLVLATGSSPFVPPIAGADRPGCFVYRTIEDLQAIREAGAKARSGVVIGGGLLGLEAAKALKDLGLETHVVEFASRLMAVQIDESAARLLHDRIAALGVGVHTGKRTTEIADAPNAAHRLCFADGGGLEADLIVFSAGIRPRDELARAAGLQIGERGGVAIDEFCRTSDPSIYAAGECAAFAGKTFGLVAPGYQMAAVVAAQVLGMPTTPFGGADMSTKLKLLGVGVASIGDAHGATAGATSCSYTDERRGVHKKLIFDRDGRRLLGAILIGETDDYGMLLSMAQNALPLPENPEHLILPPAGATAGGAVGAAAFPDSVQICSCNGVTKGALCAAVAAGATTVGALKQRTKAATSCGGCASLVTQILKSELARRGVAVDNHLCEHFPHSRQELFHLVRVGELRTFAAVLAKHGRSITQQRGC